MRTRGHSNCTVTSSSTSTHRNIGLLSQDVRGEGTAGCLLTVGAVARNLTIVVGRGDLDLRLAAEAGSRVGPTSMNVSTAELLQKKSSHDKGIGVSAVVGAEGREGWGICAT